MFSRIKYGPGFVFKNKRIEKRILADVLNRVKYRSYRNTFFGVFSVVFYIDTVKYQQKRETRLWSEKRARATFLADFVNTVKY